MIACTYLGTMLPYVNKYVLRFDDSRLSFAFTSLMAAQTAGALRGAWISRRFGLEKGFTLSSLGLLVSGLGFFAEARISRCC